MTSIPYSSITEFWTSRDKDTGIERLISSEEDRKIYGHNAVSSSEKFSADKMAKDYYEIYLKACKGW